MQKAEVVLSAIRKRGTEGKPLHRVYRQLFNRELYLLAYGKLYRNAGATTPGPDVETVDGMSLERIEKIINLLRHERYAWKPVRRVYIKKQHSIKKRPLGMPGWNDKLVQEVIRLILEAYYEPQFNTCSHGFRPNLGCGTALQEILYKWDGTKWFIEGDIKGCLDPPS
jgi:retron-type reverse transcriptase